jgi:hypothetical protein
MEPKYRTGDRVDRKGIPCQKNGLIVSVYIGALSILYRVKWCACSGEYFENELVPAAPLELENQGGQGEKGN